MAAHRPTRTVLIRLNAKIGDQWKEHVTDPVHVISVDGPYGRWQMEPDTRPADEDWQAAAAAVEQVIIELKGLPDASYDEVAVFALGPYGIGALLGYDIWQHLAYQSKRVAYYQWTGSGYESWGPVDVCERSENASAPASLVEGPGDDSAPYVAVLVPVTRVISARDVDVAMSAHAWGRDIPQVTIELVDDPGQRSVAGAEHAVTVAERLVSALDQVKKSFPNAQRHLFYVGPLAILMLAARALRVPKDVIVYDIQPTGHYLPTARFPAGALCEVDHGRPEVVIIAEDHVEASAVALVGHLRRYHVRVFFAPLSLRPGDRWDEVRHDTLRVADVVVVLIDTQTSQAWYRNEEICIAIDRAGRDATRLVPIKLDPDAEMPYGITRVLHMDWPDGDTAQLDGLTRDLVGLLRVEQTGMIPRPRLDEPSR